MIRVSKHVTRSGEAIIALEGHADTEAIAEITSAIEAAGPGCALDVSGLKTLDAAAREFLAGLRRRGVEIKGASMYVRALIEEPQP